MQHQRRAAPRSLLCTLLTWGLFLAGCGGPGTPASPHEQPGDNHPAVPPESPAVEEDDPLGPPLADAEPKDTDRCNDGQCFECGDAICLESFYCDEALGSCGWLPECTGRNSSCECLSKALSGCSCREEQGHLVVNCDR